MPWCLPATVVLLLYLSLISLSPHPIFFHLTEPTTTSLPCHTCYTCHPPHTQTHTPRQTHSPHCLLQHHQPLPHSPTHHHTHTQPNRGAIAQPERHEVLHLLGTLIRTIPGLNRPPRERSASARSKDASTRNCPKRKSEE